MLSDDQRLRFNHEGYLHLAGFFPPSLMDELDTIIFEHFGEAPEYAHDQTFIRSAATEIVPWFPQREGVSAFDSIERDPRFQSVTADVLGPGWTPQYCMAMFSKAGTAGQAWHQDCPPENKKHFNLNRLIYTSDILDAIGGQIVIRPGTHGGGALPVGEPHEDLEGQIILSPKKGDVILLHGHCWHRVLPVKARWRFSVNYRAAPAGTPEDITDICVYRTMRYRFSTAEIVEHRSTKSAPL